MWHAIIYYTFQPIHISKRILSHLFVIRSLYTRVCNLYILHYSYAGVKLLWMRRSADHGWVGYFWFCGFCLFLIIWSNKICRTECVISRIILRILHFKQTSILKIWNTCDQIVLSLYIWYGIAFHINFNWDMWMKQWCACMHLFISARLS